MIEPHVKITVVRERLAEVKGQLDECATKVEYWSNRGAELQPDYEMLARWLESLEAHHQGDGVSSSGSEGRNVPPKYQGLTINAALQLIAREKGGLLITKHAARELRAAGFFPDPKKASNSVSSTVHRGKNTWRRQKRGVYLLQASPRTNGVHSVSDGVVPAKLP